MARTETTETVKSASKNGSHGAEKAGEKAAEKAAEATPAQGAQGEESAEAKRSRGVIPTMPACILYRSGGRVFAAIHHPVDGTSYVESGKGIGSAKGALEDSGFHLSAVSDTGAEWLAAKLPAGAELVGYCKITGFPLPVQSA